jgi:hypothetical protein
MTPRLRRSSQRTPEPARPAPTKSSYEVTVMLVTALAWPAIVVLLLFIFRAPIQAVVAQLPSLMASSNTISVAGVSVQVDRKLRSQASAEALASMAALTGEGVRTLMMLEHKTPIYTAQDVRDGRIEQEYGELIRANLAEVIPWEGERWGPGTKGVRVTDRGRRVQELALLIIADFAGQISAAASAATAHPPR